MRFHRHQIAPSGHKLHQSSYILSQHTLQEHTQGIVTTACVDSNLMCSRAARTAAFGEFTRPHWLAMAFHSIAVQFHNRWNLQGPFCAVRSCPPHPLLLRCYLSEENIAAQHSLAAQFIAFLFEYEEHQDSWWCTQPGTLRNQQRLYD